MNLKLPTSYFGFANVIKLLGEVFGQTFIEKQSNFDFVQMVLNDIEGSLDGDQELKKIFNNATSLRTFLTNNKLLGNIKHKMSILAPIIKAKLEEIKHS